MKSLLIVLIAASFASNLWASDERLVRSADMKIAEAKGALEGVAHAELEQYQEYDVPAFKDTYQLILNEEKISLILVATESAGCGSLERTFIRSIDLNGNGADEMTITMVDHTTRMCEDYRPFLWEVKVEYHSLLHFNDGELLLLGNPGAVDKNFLL